MTTISICNDVDLQFGRRAFIGFNTSFYTHPFDRTKIATFQTITSSGVKQEGYEVSAFFSSRELAEDYFQDAVRQYIKLRDGNIFWRQLPVFKERNLYTVEVWVNQAPKLVPFHGWYGVGRLAVANFEPLIGLQEEE